MLGTSLASHTRGIGAAFTITINEKDRSACFTMQLYPDGPGHTPAELAHICTRSAAFGRRFRLRFVLRALFRRDTTMQRFLRRFVVLSAACLLGCSGLTQAQSSTSREQAGARLTAIADAYLAALIKASPEFA